MATTIQKTSAYGTWKSPIAPDLLANADNSPIDCFAHLGLGNTVFYYLEGRASKGGRQVIVRDVDGVQEDILSSEFSAQSKIHEYGGSAFTLVKDGRLIFVNGNSQAIYYLSPQTKKTSLLYADSKGRFADFDQIVIKNDETMIVAVHEEPERQYNELVLLDPSDQTIITTISVESRRYALTGAQLFVAEFENKRFINHRKIAGQHTKESISQPRWGPDGILYFASDRSGYYKLYRIKDFNSEIEILGPTGLCNHERVEFSSPEWRLGARTYVNLTPNLIVATYLYQAGSGLATIDINTNKWTDLPTDYVEISYINVVSETKFIVCGSTATSPKEVVELDIKDSSYRRVIAKSTSLELSSGIFSRGRSIVFTRSNGTHAYAWLWSPHNPKHKDLNGKWGELDASDASAFARHMCGEACPEDIRAFPDQVDITGGSAGGYTVLRALTVNDFPWTAGVSLCGIGNITMLEADTHKFESRYTRILLDPAGKTLTEEERSEIYHDKSPQFFADRITAATLLLQGNEDKVVLLHQAKDMTREIERAGQIVKLVVYEGEGHGFRKAESIKDMLGQMELWWSKYLVRP